MQSAEPTDSELILQWWNNSRTNSAATVSTEIRSAYTREVVHPEVIARFDATLAELLSPREWAYVSSRLYPDRHAQ